MALDISSALSWATKQLLLSSETPLLDAQILLSHCLKVTKSYLYAWPENNLTPSQEEAFKNFIWRRKQNEPVAYIVGHQEFWSLDLIVTPDTLIPRPETEILVDLILKKFSHTQPMQFADLGTGTGAIALAIAQERPHWIIHATDSSPNALVIAKKNCEKYHFQNVHFHQGVWCHALPKIDFNLIVSNPPYLTKNEMESCQKELTYEPKSALYAGENGLGDIQALIEESKHFLKKKSGYLFLEHGFMQGAAVRDLFAANHYQAVESHRDLAGLERVTSACYRHSPPQ